MLESLQAISLLTIMESRPVASTSGSDLRHTSAVATAAQANTGRPGSVDSSALSRRSQSRKAERNTVTLGKPSAKPWKSVV